MNRKLKNDLLLGGAACLIAVVAIILSFRAKAPGQYVSVQRDGVEIARYSLMKDGEYRFADGKRENILVISNGWASIREASCPNQICVNHTPISQAGETVICLPNRLVIEIIGSAPAVDARA